MNVFKRSLSSSFLVAGALLACVSAEAAPGCGSVSAVERRIVEHANGDVEVLRSFVWQTAIVHGVNMVDVRMHLDQWRAAVECDRVAAAQSAEQTATAKPADASAGGDAAVIVSQR